MTTIFLKMFLESSLKTGTGYAWAGQNRTINLFNRRSSQNFFVSIESVGDLLPTGSGIMNL